MKGLIARLSKDLDTHTRSDGTVVRLHAGGSLIGEIVVGETTIRVNFKEPFTPDVELLAMAESVRISGRSKSWAGGLRVTPDNFNAVKQVLNLVAKEAVEVQNVERTVRESIAALESVANSGRLDEDFEKDLKQLLDRRLTPYRRRGQGRGMTVISTG